MELSAVLGLLPDQVQRPQPYPRSRSHPYALCMDSLAAAYTHSAIYRHDCTHTSARAHTHKHTHTHQGKLRVPLGPGAAPAPPQDRQPVTYEHCLRAQSCFSARTVCHGKAWPVMARLPREATACILWELALLLRKIGSRWPTTLHSAQPVACDRRSAPLLHVYNAAGT
jgi:hypothetical protein